ncbi:MAG: hypothetical protein ACFFD2_22340, partial [Promethearchaeota archaeon]
DWQSHYSYNLLPFSYVLQIICECVWANTSNSGSWQSAEAGISGAIGLHIPGTHGLTDTLRRNLEQFVYNSPSTV